MSCAQSNAAAVAADQSRAERALPVSLQEGAPATVFGAVLNGSSDGFRAAAGDFGEAVALWPKTLAGPPSRIARPDSHRAPRAGPRMADSYPDLTKELDLAHQRAHLPVTPIMSTAFCSDLIGTAKVWAGWLAPIARRSCQSRRGFSVYPGNAWNFWVAGRNAAEKRNSWPKPRASTKKALDARPLPIGLPIGGRHHIRPEARSGGRPLSARPDRLRVRALRRRRPALRRRHQGDAEEDSYAIYLRARSKDASHAVRRRPSAITSCRCKRPAPTRTRAWNIGQAYYYRGLVFYRQKDFARAESEFSNAIAAARQRNPADDVTALARHGPGLGQRLQHFGRRARTARRRRRPISSPKRKPPRWTSIAG